MLKTTLHIPFLYKLHSARLTGMDAEDYTTHTFTVYFTLSPSYRYGCWRLYYTYFFCILYALLVLQVWMLKTTMHTFLYTLHSPRLTGMDAEDHYIYRSFIVYSPPPPTRITGRDVEDHYIYLNFIVYSPPVLQVGMLKTTIYPCLIVYCLHVLQVWLARTTPQS